MTPSEPMISIGLIENAKEIRGRFNGDFELPASIKLQGSFRLMSDGERVVLVDDEDVEVARSMEIHCRSLFFATFTLNNVKIGIGFHWERNEEQTYNGDLWIRLNANRALMVINVISLESYLQSVISSEMSAEAPIEFLKAHAIISRSWLMAMLARREKTNNDYPNEPHSVETEHEIVRWYDREDHAFFDVCADDHCQRYQGITKIISKSAKEAVESTRGIVLVANNEVADARFSKACGGLTELFENCWEGSPMMYLQSVPDSSVNAPPILSESDAERWITSSPDAYCNTTDNNILKKVLSSADRETTDFFRWNVEYSREQLEEILRLKSGFDFGTVMDILPLKRGPSGRIVRLKIIGSQRTMIVGKELEIRRWLSASHLYSSAFIVKIERDGSGLPLKFVFHGAGWGHGVGLCQIGAAVMASKGFTAEEIVKHYFRGIEVKKIY